MKVVHSKGLRLALRGATLAAVAGAVIVPLFAEAGPVRFTGEGHAQHPVWSLNGKHVAFEVNPYAGDINLFFSEVTGDIAKDAKKVPLPGGGSGFGGSGQVVINPTWHPQGIAVFEGSNQGGEYRLYFAQPNGSPAAEMLSTQKAPGNITFPSVSPDGNLLAYVSSQTGNGDIRLWNRSTDAVTQLTDSSESEMFPSFNKDASKILFTRKKNDTEDVFEMPVAGGAATQVAGGPGDQTRPIYAGDRVVFFTSERGTDKWDLAVVEAGQKKVLAKDVRLPVRARPAVTPDGQWVAYGSDDPTKNTAIYLAKLDGSATVTISTEFTACGEPALTKQGDRVLLAFTALPNAGSDWRSLQIVDVTSKL